MSSNILVFSISVMMKKHVATPVVLCLLRKMKESSKYSAIMAILKIL